ncbi:MAG: Lipoprotein E [Steroidobacteraceae bacterium]|nr:Lipoprotein E [Steroidobacteraceae bacterium]
MRWTRCGLAPALLLVVASSFAAGDTACEQLNAVLWTQTAAEHDALTTQVYAQATARLPVLAAPGSAALEQWGRSPDAIASLPTAIVLDIDETILDNSAFQARQVKARAGFSPADWEHWVDEAAAGPIPGAREFLRAAHSAGHRIFYLTNRACPLTPEPAGADPCPQRTATMRNLVALGFPDAGNPDSYLMRNGTPDWRTADKTSRRAAIAQKYRIVALFGDDLRDFVERGVFDARRAELMPMFGARWFVLPNPMYGSWERALVAPACTGRERAADGG